MATLSEADARWFGTGVLCYARFMHCLLLGGTGYIGARLAEVLVAAGHRVTAVARGTEEGSLPGRAEELRAAGVRVVRADLSRRGDLRANVDPADVEVVVQGVCSFLEPRGPGSLTLGAMEEAIAFARQCPRLSQVIDLSSSLAFGPTAGIAAVDERFDAPPDTIHGRNKLTAERMLRESGLPWLILRATQVYGGRGSSFDWVIVERLRRGQMVLAGDGRNRVGLVHVDDVAQAVQRAVERRVTGEILNVCSGDTTATQGALFDLVTDGLRVPRARRIPYGVALAYAWASERAARLRGREPALIPDMVRILGTDRVVDIARARERLGYQPAWPRTLEGVATAYRDVFAGERAPYVRLGGIEGVQGLQAAAAAPGGRRGEDERKALWAQYASAMTSDGVLMYDAMLRLRTTTRAWATFAEHLPADGTGIAVDYGCGTGFVARTLALRNPKARVIGIELEEAFIAHARRALSGCPNAEVRQGDLSLRLPLGDGEVDFVGAHNWVIPYLTSEEQQAFVRELARVHAPGSVVLGATMLAPFTFRDVVLSNLHAELVQPRVIWVAMRELVPQVTAKFDEHMSRGWMSYPDLDQLRAWHLAAGFRSFEVVTPMMPLRHVIRWRRKAPYAAVMFRAVRG